MLVAMINRIVLQPPALVAYGASSASAGGGRSTPTAMYPSSPPMLFRNRRPLCAMAAVRRVPASRPPAGPQFVPKRPDEAARGKPGAAFRAGRQGVGKTALHGMIERIREGAW